MFKFTFENLFFSEIFFFLYMWTSYILYTFFFYRMSGKSIKRDNIDYFWHQAD